MKKLVSLFIAIAAMLPLAAFAQQDLPALQFENAHDIVEYIVAGWNLGNTLDAHPHGFTAGGTQGLRPDWTPEMQETLWGNPVTTRENILAIRDAGFNAIRIPITFYTFVSEEDNFLIPDEWRNRFVQVVDYAYEAGMVVIVNTHHDERFIGLGLRDAAGNLIPQYSNNPARATLVEPSTTFAFLDSIWTQLSDIFADYGQRLIFEGLNEPRTIGSSAEWGGGTAVEREYLNQFNQAFVNTVRAHESENNRNRFLMVPTYAAAVGVAAFDGWRMPTDPAGHTDHIIVSLHAYTPWRFALDAGTNVYHEWSVNGTGDQNGPGPVSWALNLSRDTFPDYPIIIGEMGALNRDNLDSRVAWLSFYNNLARQLGMRVFWWDNGQFDVQNNGGTTYWGPDQFAIFDRRNNVFPFPELVEVLVNPAPIWNAGAVFNTGDTVAWNGRVFRANWWTQNQEPSSSPWNAWTEVSAEFNSIPLWSSSAIFDAGDEVLYNGNVYRASWWTRNQAPSTPFGPWVRVAE